MRVIDGCAKRRVVALVVTVLVASPLLLFGAPSRPIASAAAASDHPDLSWIVSLRELERLDGLNGPLAQAVFNTPQTFVLLPGRRLDRLDQATARRFPAAVMTASFTDERELAAVVSRHELPARVRAVLYAAEDWSLTPNDQQRDPKLYYRLAGQVARAHRLRFLAAPGVNLVDRLAPATPRSKRPARFVSLRLPADAARFAAVYVVGAQHLETDPARYLDFVQAAARQARGANGKVEVVAALSTNLLGRKQPVRALLRAALETDGFVRGYWLRDPGADAVCRGCARPYPGIAVSFLEGLEPPVPTPPLPPPPLPSPPPSPSPAACSPNAILVNPCGPWLGAVAGGNPQAASDPVSQFDYVEQLVGHQLDIFRDYDSPGRALPLTSTELHFAERAGTYIDVNWKPATKWANADGGDAAVNGEIDRVAASIKSIAPHQIFLTVWHEPQNDVSGGTSCHINPDATAGTPAQYRAMWANVEQRFAADGVTNVVWVMNYQAPSSGEFDCLVKPLWPGNSLVDWVIYDTYSRNSGDTWANTVGRFYNVLLNDSDASTDFASKPWGLGEFGTCSNTDDASAQQFYLDASAALEAGTYPNLKMYIVYDNTKGPQAGLGCLTDYDAAGQPDPAKQADFNQLADAALAMNQQ